MSTLTDAINPILAELAVAKTDWLYFKGKLDAAKSDVASLQAQSSSKEASIATDHPFADPRDSGVQWERSEIIALSKQMGFSACHAHMWQWLLDWGSAYYIGIESQLKTKIIEVSGDPGLFTTYVPVRPGVMPERQVTGARQLSINEEAERLIDEMKRNIGLSK